MYLIRIHLWAGKRAQWQSNCLASMKPGNHKMLLLKIKIYLLKGGGWRGGAAVQGM